jgi:hypothetical protein
MAPRRHPHKPPRPHLNRRRIARLPTSRPSYSRSRTGTPRASCGKRARSLHAHASTTSTPSRNGAKSYCYAPATARLCAPPPPPASASDTSARRLPFRPAPCIPRRAPTRSAPGPDGQREMAHGGRCGRKLDDGRHARRTRSAHTPPRGLTMTTARATGVTIRALIRLFFGFGLGFVRAPLLRRRHVLPANGDALHLRPWDSPWLSLDGVWWADVLVISAKPRAWSSVEDGTV